MTNALRAPVMTQEEFFGWAERQDGRYEFDGIAPVAMTGGTANHNQIARNFHYVARGLLAGSGCRVRGPDDGVATVGRTVRYPDALIACGRTPGRARLVSDVRMVLEVASGGNAAQDRVLKLGEYHAVPTIQTYVIAEQDRIELTVFERRGGGWADHTLGAGGVLRLRAPDLSIDVDALYDDVELA